MKALQHVGLGINAIVMEPLYPSGNTGPIDLDEALTKFAQKHNRIYLVLYFAIIII